MDHEIRTGRLVSGFMYVAMCGTSRFHDVPVFVGLYVDLSICVDSEMETDG